MPHKQQKKLLFSIRSCKLTIFFKNVIFQLLNQLTKEVQILIKPTPYSNKSTQKSMKIFFINTPGDYPNQFPPLGMLYLAATAQKENHEVNLYDLAAGNASYESFIQEIKSVNPQILCFSIYTTNLENSTTIINNIKRLLPETIVIVGGPHISALPRETISNCQPIDFEVFGEGEVTFIELIKAIQSKGDFSKIDGLCYRDGTEIIQNKPRERLKDLDSIPFPAYELVKRFKYAYDKFAYGRKVGIAASSRGCPYNCTFCNKSVFGNKYIRRSPQNLIDELHFQKKVLGIDELYFVDDLFVTDQKWLDRFLDLYKKSGLKLPWKCLGRVDQVEEATYVKMKEGGCFLLQFGVESGDQRILNSIRKGITVEKAKEAVRSCQRAGINAASFFILGHPGETYQSAIKTIKAAQEINADVCHFFVLVPFPGTYNYQFVPDELKKNWKSIRYYHKNEYPMSLCEIEPEELYYLEKQARYEFYGRLQYFVHNVLSFRFPFKITVIKAGASTIYFLIKCLLTITGKRIYNKIKKKSLKEICRISEN